MNTLDRLVSPADTLKVVDVMTALPEVLLPTETVIRAAEIMREHDIGLVPVVLDWQSMRPVGVITDRDIVLRHVAEGHHYDCPVEAAMTRQPLFSVDPNDTLDTVMAVMRTQKVRRVLVTTRGGRLVGIITQADLLLHARPEDEVAVEHVLASVSEPSFLQR